MFGPKHRMSISGASTHSDARTRSDSGCVTADVLPTEPERAFGRISPREALGLKVLRAQADTATGVHSVPGRSEEFDAPPGRPVVSTATPEPRAVDAPAARSPIGPLSRPLYRGSSFVPSASRVSIDPRRS